VLADLGISVLLLEAGPMLHPAKDFKEHMWPYEAPHRGVGPHAKGSFGWSPFTLNATYGGAHIDGEPYTVAPGSDFSWFRSRIVGGRTNHYRPISLRFADYDFTPYSRDGLGTDWPITYDELSPYYDKAETFIGVTDAGSRTCGDGFYCVGHRAKVEYRAK
jgi:choline dehydrogenase-like flavoprotein